MTTLSFENVKTCKELATLLNVDEKALAYVKLYKPEKECSTLACVFLAVLGNYGKCVCCGKSWFPQEHTDGKGVTTVDRGHFLLGPEFSHLEHPKLKACCCCDMELCRGIGYTNSLMMFPTDESILKLWLDNTGVMLSPETKKNVRSNPRNFQLAYWHFYPEHIYFDSSAGKYKKLERARYVDGDGSGIVRDTPNFPIPNNSLMRFKEERELELEQLPQQRWIRNELPQWVSKMLAKERQHTQPPPRDPAKSPVKKKARGTSPSAQSVSDSDSENYTRALFATKATYELEEVVLELRNKLSESKADNASLKSTIKELEKEIKDLKALVGEQKEIIGKLEAVLTSIKDDKKILSFDSLRRGGVLEKFVKEYTFFHTVEERM